MTFLAALLLLTIASSAQLGACQRVVHHGARNLGGQTGESGESDKSQVTYIFPILRWGPNNQKRDLRQVLAIAKELNAGVILTGIFKHYMDGHQPPMAVMSPAPFQKHRTRRLTVDAPLSKSATASAQNSFTGTKDATDKPNDTPFSQRGRAVNANLENSKKVVKLSRQAQSIETARRTHKPAEGSCFTEPLPLYMPFEEVLDRDALAGWVPTITVKELRQQGWDGSLEAVFGPQDSIQASSWNNNRYIERSLEAEGVKVASNAPEVHIEQPMFCEPSKISKMEQEIKKYRVIGLQVIMMGDNDSINEDASSGLIKQPKQVPEDQQTLDGTQKCYKTLDDANHLLRPAPWLRRLASRYVKEVMGFGDQPYLAVHIRPFPDECLTKWRHGKFEPNRLTALCIQPHQQLHLRFTRCVQKAMKAANVDKVFIMTHPTLTPTVSTILGMGGVTDAKFMEMAQLLWLAGCKDKTATFLSMVEEEIAVSAEAFLGTAWSSITQSIAHQRAGLQRMQNQYFENMEC